MPRPTSARRRARRAPGVPAPPRAASSVTATTPPPVSRVRRRISGPRGGVASMMPSAAAPAIGWTATGSSDPAADARASGAHATDWTPKTRGGRRTRPAVCIASNARAAPSSSVPAPSGDTTRRADPRRAAPRARRPTSRCRRCRADSRGASHRRRRRSSIGPRHRRRSGGPLRPARPVAPYTAIWVSLPGDAVAGT